VVPGTAPPFEKISLFGKILWLSIVFFWGPLLSSGCASSARFKTTSETKVEDSSNQDIYVHPEPAAADTEKTGHAGMVSATLSENNPLIDRGRLLNIIMSYMGTRYIPNGTDSVGFDCSGFVAKIFSDACGLVLPHSSTELFMFGKPVEKDSILFGDLVFFKTDRGIPSHVGIYVGDGLFAHASLTIGVTISILASEYYHKRYLGIRRIFY
jgi:cell wall-associated NlpC family hydrolase